MPEDKRIDFFKPQQPSIPGVATDKAPINLSPPPPAVYSQGPPQAPVPVSPLRWVALTVLAALFLLCGGFFYWTRQAAPSVPAEPAQAAVATDLPRVVSGAAKLPEGPGPVATTEELSRAWSSKRFTFRDSVTGELGPALVVKLPGGEYWGFSLREPFGTCELQLVSDRNLLMTVYNVKADHPLVVDPCDRTVYDLLRYGGGAADNGLVRGDIIQGTGIRPPIAIEIRVKGNDILAVRME